MVQHEALIDESAIDADGRLHLSQLMSYRLLGDERLAKRDSVITPRTGCLERVLRTGLGVDSDDQTFLSQTRGQGGAASVGEKSSDILSRGPKGGQGE